MRGGTASAGDRGGDVETTQGSNCSAEGACCRDAVRDRLVAVDAAAADLERLRQDVVSTVNHELRTPLSNIIGYCELIVDRDDLDPEVRALLGVVERNSQRLATLINDLLLLADLDAGARAGAGRPVDLAVLVHDVADRVRPTAVGAGLVLVVDAVLPGPLVQGDPAQLERAVQHLAANAVTFAVDGTTVRLRVLTGDAEATVEVSDDGAGIDPVEMPALLSRFGRAARVRSDQVQGLGIGLSVASSVAEHHGGRLTLDSLPGLGTTARLVLPLSSGTGLPSSTGPEMPST